jgi:hypothetical protein
MFINCFALEGTVVHKIRFPKIITVMPKLRGEPSKTTRHDQTPVIVWYPPPTISIPHTRNTATSPSPMYFRGYMGDLKIDFPLIEEGGKG